MRAGWAAGLLVAGCVAACGVGRPGPGSGAAGTPGATGNTGDRTRELHIRVTGKGTVRGGTFDCRSDCSVSLDQGAHLEASPDTRWEFDGWQADCAGTAGCDLDMSADRDVAASFSPDPAAPVQVHVALTGEGQGRVTSSPVGVDCPSGPCDLNVPVGTAVVLTAHPGNNATLSGWSGACASDPCRFVASADATVYVGFAVARHTLTVAVNGPGHVQSSPAGIDCPGRCSASFEAHSLVMLHGTPDAGNFFQDWGTACGDAYRDCPVFMHGDYSVTATFASTERRFTLTVYQRGYGSGRVQSNPPGLDCTSDTAGCNGSFSWGTKVTLSATPAPGSTFSGWGAACPDTTCTVELRGDRGAVVTFDMPAPVGEPYTVRELPAVEGSQDMYPYGINSRGDLAGTVALPARYSPPVHAFFYDAVSAAASRIGDDGGYCQAATGINDARQVSITTMNSDGERVYRWEAGTLTLIAGTEYYFVGSSGIDSSGKVYGSTVVYRDPFHAYVWDGALHDLGAGVDGSTNVLPPDTNGRLYGTLGAPGGQHLIEYVSSGGIRDYGVPFAGFSGGKIRGGRMVGAVDLRFMEVTGYVYDLPDGPLRTPLGLRAGQFNAVNATGDVVGTLLDGTNSPEHAILWRQGRLVDLTASLNDLSWNLIAATAVNDTGQIAGTGYHDGHRAAFLLTPRQER